MKHERMSENVCMKHINFRREASKQIILQGSEYKSRERETD